MVSKTRQTLNEKYVNAVSPNVRGLLVNKRGTVLGYIKSCDGHNETYHNETYLVPRSLGRSFRKLLPDVELMRET
jgi:hypothetical protein